MSGVEAVPLTGDAARLVVLQVKVDVTRAKVAAGAGPEWTDSLQKLEARLEEVKRLCR